MVQMACLLFGIAIQSVGIVLEVRPQVTMMSAEAFVFYVSRRWQQEFGKVKVWFDCSLVLLAVVCSVGFALTSGTHGSTATPASSLWATGRSTAGSVWASMPACR